MCPKQPGAFFMSPSVIQLRMIFRTKPCQSYLGFREGWKWNEVVTRWKSPNVQETNCTRKKKSIKQIIKQVLAKNTKTACSFLKASKAEWFAQCILCQLNFLKTHTPNRRTRHMRFVDGRYCCWVNGLHQCHTQVLRLCLPQKLPIHRDHPIQRLPSARGRFSVKFETWATLGRSHGMTCCCL